MGGRKKINREEVLGMKIGYLTLLSFIKKEGRRSFFLAKCVCGTDYPVLWDNFRSGKTKSCGCKRFKPRKVGIEKKLYRVWRSMRQRCLNPNCKVYRYYGGRGIKICDNWSVFENFYKDNKDRYIEGYDLDRVDNNGNYTLENTEFVSHKTNSQHTRRIKLTQEIAEIIRYSKEETRFLAMKYNVSKTTIRSIRANKTWN